MTPEDFKIVRKLADQLMACSDGGVSLVDEIAALTQAQCQALDTMVFECEECGQWFAIQEKAADSGDSMICRGCERDDSHD